MELSKKTIRSLILGAVGCIVLYWLLHETDRLTAILKDGWTVLSPFIAGASVAFILNVPMRAIEKWLSGVKQQGLRRGLALLLTLVAVALVLTGVIYLLLPQLLDAIKSLLDTLPDFFDRVQGKINEYLSANPELMKWVTENTDFASLDWAGLIQKAVTFISNSLSAIVDKTVHTVINLGTGIFNGVLSFVFAIYCLGRKETLARQGRKLLYAIFPEKIGDETVRILRMTNSTFSNFISGQCLEAVILGLMFAVSMTIFGMPYMPLVSVVIVVTALVPIVGAFVGCFVGAFFILVQDPPMAFWFVIMFLVLQQIEGNLIYPRVVGTSIGLPGMWVLVAVAVGGDLMGVGGMLLMIPLASVLYALAREFAEKRLASKGIDPNKLRPHPPQLRSGFKQKQIDRREKKRKQRKEQSGSEQEQQEEK